MKKSVTLFAAALAVSAAFAAGSAEARGGRGGGGHRGGHDSGSVIIGGGAGQHIGGNHGGLQNNHGGNSDGGMRMGNTSAQALTRGGGRITPDVPRPERHRHVAYRSQRSDCIYSGAHVYPGVGGYWVQPRTHCGETYPGNGAMGPSPNLFR